MEETPQLPKHPIKMVKLVSGENIICTLQDSGKKVLLGYPLVVLVTTMVSRSGQTQAVNLSFRSYFQFHTDIHEPVPVLKQHIIGIYDAMPLIESQYAKALTKIAEPEPNNLFGNHTSSVLAPHVGEYDINTEPSLPIIEWVLNFLQHKKQVLGYDPDDEVSIQELVERHPEDGDSPDIDSDVIDDDDFEDDEYDEEFDDDSLDDELLFEDPDDPHTPSPDDIPPPN